MTSHIVSCYCTLFRHSTGPQWKPYHSLPLFLMKKPRNLFKFYTMRGWWRLLDRHLQPPLTHFAARTSIGAKVIPGGDCALSHCRVCPCILRFATDILGKKQNLGMNYQDIEDHIEMMSDPEPLEADSSEIMGCKDVHDSKDY